MRIVFLLVLLALLLSAPVSAQPNIAFPLTYYFPQDITFGLGDAWSVGKASVGVALDRGVVMLARNPAAMNSGRNEIYGGAGLWGALATSSGFKAPEVHTSVGALGYMNSFGRGAVGAFWTPRSTYRAGAETPLSVIRNESFYREAGLAGSYRLSGRLSLGLSIAYFHGVGERGVEVEGGDDDTIEYRPAMLLPKLALHWDLGTWQLGALLEIPAQGTVKRDSDPEYTGPRLQDEYRISGGTALRLGAGRSFGPSALEAELELVDAGGIQVEDEPLTDGGMMLAAGISGHTPIIEGILLNAGAKFRFQDPEGYEHIVLGVGGLYQATPEVDLFGSAGVILPYGDGLKGTSLDKVTPWLLRAGAAFHGE